MKIVFESSTAIVTYLDNGHLLHTDRTSGALYRSRAPGRILRARSVPIGSCRAVLGSRFAAKNEPPPWLPFAERCLGEGAALAGRADRRNGRLRNAWDDPQGCDAGMIHRTHG
jgi:hypothetical protein